jgi:hypothetical protein
MRRAEMRRRMSGRRGEWESGRFDFNRPLSPSLPLTPSKPLYYKYESK